MKMSTAVVDQHGETIDPLLLRTTLQSMLIVPKLIQPILMELKPGEINDDFYDRLAGFHADLIASYFKLEKN